MLCLAYLLNIGLPIAAAASGPARKNKMHLFSLRYVFYLALLIDYKLHRRGTPKGMTSSLLIDYLSIGKCLLEG